MQCCLSCSVLHSLTAVMQGSPVLREAYDSTVTYTRLRELLSLIGPPSIDVLAAVIDMVRCYLVARGLLISSSYVY